MNNDDNYPHPVWRQWKEMTCPQCFKSYILGTTGTINGCDECEGIQRDENGLIIMPRSRTFISRVERPS